MKSRTLASGLLLVDKARGGTSHDVVAKVRRIFGQREVGHTGTLDPMATGLLVLALGRATRVARFVEAAAKLYTGTVTLGRSTTTFDAEGDTVLESPLPTLDAEVVDAALAGLLGQIEQRPPAFSAIKVDGERLYAKARRGEAVEVPTRQVVIHSLKATRVALPEIDIETEVSKGTYIRSLAVQIGDKLGCPAHLSALRRERVGTHSVARAHALENLRGDPDELVPLHEALVDMPPVHLTESMLTDVRHGRPLKAADLVEQLGLDLAAETPIRLMASPKDLVAVATIAGDLRCLPAGGRAMNYACVLMGAEAG